ncbi:DUF6456 domain-containing protein [Salipiger sp. PrR002]|uniref:DUF6456 domain-containing protein n=1 Tax=Salipiger sp. PrR002 TaxID=2706489 RepID=UPI0013BA7A0C|nr:DUF6456 domain-containing protein [Salipiger sp. PrR002]NDV97959.1 helix-turn-helix domain-containing protein [Salipiger sp. PrR002]NDW55450.1 helix-turn-helix domain-containing protein [Salipiger sp. PrR004]
MISSQHHAKDTGLPAWVPEIARLYLAHTEGGAGIRALARKEGCHASTVLRQVRRMELLRDDPLVDEALRRLGATRGAGVPHAKEGRAMKTPEIDGTTPDAATLSREARRVLRRLCESGAMLAVAAEMDKAVVVRDGAEGGSARTAVVSAPVAQAMALKGWIRCDSPGRISRYRITAAGRSALGHLLAEQESRLRGFAEAQAGFESGREAEAALEEEDADPRGKRRFALSESPLAVLARRRDRDGQRFLEDGLVRAGERLREDFELAQMGPRVTQNWDQFLTAGVRVDAGDLPAQGGDAARARFAAALRELGPGLGDAALRCCCYLEGLEETERRMGWAARSGKVVLRIALQRLRSHYEKVDAAGGGLIG